MRTEIEILEHGQERNRRMERQYSEQNFKTLDGKPLNISFCSSELSVAEKYCKHCNDWVSTESLGIIGFIVCPDCNNKW